MTVEFESLLDAINDNDIDSASTLIASGFVNGDKHALLHAAARGRVEIMALLLSAGAEVDVVDKWERTACHYAVSNGHLAALEFLIARGANVSAFDNDKKSLLSGAICRHSDKIAIMLLDAGAPIDGLTMHELVRAAAKSTALTNRLVARGVNVCELRDSVGRTPCHVVNVESEDFEAIMRHLVCVVGIDMNSVDGFSRTPLHTLSFKINGSDNAMRVLIELGADVDSRDDNGQTALHYASARACIPSRLPQLYIAAGADFLLVDNTGRSACHLAAQYQYYDALCALVAVGADLDQADNSGNTARMIAASFKCRLPTTADIEAARRYIEAKRLDLVRNRAFEVCTGLQPLHLDALLLCEIMLYSCGRGALHVLFHQWWAIATTVKHFTQRSVRDIPNK